MRDTERVPLDEIEEIRALKRGLHDLRATTLKRIHDAQLRTPSGMVAPFAGATTPAEWLPCDGASKLVADFPALHVAIGYVWGGSGDNFNVPDMRGRMPIGVGTLGSETYALADLGGAAFHTLTEAQLAVHDHTVGSLTPTNNQSASHDHGASGLTTGNQSTSHRHTGGAHVHPMPHDHTGLGLAADASVGGAAERVRDAGSGQPVGPSTVANTSSTSAPNGGLQNASHTHAISGTTANQNSSHNHVITGSVANAGSGNAHENRPAFGAMNYIIKI